jgi:hypothetical protein
MKLDLPRGAATGVGSLPGTDITDAIAMTFGELPNLPYLPELPARGPGADIIGRGAGFLVDIPVELYAGRWQVARRPGADLRRTHDLLKRDLDALTDAADGFTGLLKLQSAGVFTLAVGIGLLKDHGAVRDLAASLGEGLRAHVAEVRRRVPGASVVLQVDEPSLPAALAGRVPTESGLYTYRSVAVADAREILSSIVDAVGVPVVFHCCATDAPVSLFAEAGAAGIAVDLSLAKRLDPLGEAIDAGLALFAGVSGADAVNTLWSQLGFPREMLAERVVVTPPCGLAGVSRQQAAKILRDCRETARRLEEG